MSELRNFLEKNRRALIVVALLSVLAFSSGYVFGLEGREMAGGVEARAQSISYQKGFKSGEREGYREGLEKAKKVSYKESFRDTYKESFLEQFEKAGIEEPKRVPLP